MSSSVEDKKKKEEEDAEIKKNIEALKNRFGDARTGGKGSQRRKIKVVNKNIGGDKVIKSIVKKIGAQQLGVDQVNFFKDDNTVLHFSKPEVHASVQNSTFIVTGQSQTKNIKDLLPDILQQLGPKQHKILKDIVSAGSTNEKDDIPNLIPSKDDVPTLVANKQETAQKHAQEHKHQHKHNQEHHEHKKDQEHEHKHEHKHLHKEGQVHKNEHKEGEEHKEGQEHKHEHKEGQEHKHEHTHQHKQGQVHKHEQKKQQKHDHEQKKPQHQAEKPKENLDQKLEEQPLPVPEKLTQPQ